MARKLRNLNYLRREIRLWNSGFEFKVTFFTQNFGLGGMKTEYCRSLITNLFIFLIKNEKKIIFEEKRSAVLVKIQSHISSGVPEIL